MSQPPSQRLWNIHWLPSPSRSNKGITPGQTIRSAHASDKTGNNVDSDDQSRGRRWQAIFFWESAKGHGHNIDGHIWITHLRRFMQENDITVKEGTANIPRQRHGDTFLVDAAAALPLTPRQRLYFQQCRYYLQVTLVLEIATADGRQLFPGITKGRKDPRCRHYIQYPYQPRPTAQAWAVWCRILRHTQRQRTHRTQPLYTSLVETVSLGASCEYSLDSGH